MELVDLGKKGVGGGERPKNGTEKFGRRVRAAIERQKTTGV